MLPDERINDTERLTRTRRTQDDCTTERIDDVYPTLAHLLLPIVNHRYVYRVVVIRQDFRLLEGFVLEVETVFAHLVVVILGDGIQSLMHQHGAHHRTDCIENPVRRESHPVHTEVHSVKEETQADKGQSCQYRIDDHRFHVEFEGFLRFCPDADDTDADQFRDLTAGNGIKYLEPFKQIQYELRYPVVCRNRQIHHDFQYKEDIDATAEVVVHLLLFPCLFKCHTLLLPLILFEHY